MGHKQQVGALLLSEHDTYCGVCTSGAHALAQAGTGMHTSVLGCTPEACVRVAHTQPQELL